MYFYLLMNKDFIIIIIISVNWLSVDSQLTLILLDISQQIYRWGDVPYLLP